MMIRKTLLSFSLLSQATFWVFLVCVITPVSMWSLAWPDAMYRAAFITVCHVVNFYCCYSYFIPVLYRQRKYVMLAIALLLMFFVLTSLRVSIESRFMIRLPANIPAGSRIGLIILSELTIAGFASMLRLGALNEQNQKLMEALQRDKLEAELKFLKGQISPHFLFNSINNIYTLVLTGSTNAPGALLKLSELLRYALYECNHKVTIGREVNAIQTYASLYSLKSPTELNVKWNLDIANTDHFIEPMILIPLIENTFKHSGLGASLNASAIIEIRCDQRWLTLKTWNTIGSANYDPEHGRIGMENIARRLKQLFPGGHEFSSARTGSGFIVNLKMPVL